MKTPSRRTFLASTLGAAALSVTPARASAQQEPGVATKLAHPKQPLKGSKTQFALNIEMWLRNLPFTDRIRAAADLGFQWVEFWPWQGKDISAIKDNALAHSRAHLIRILASEDLPLCNNNQSINTFES